jgi:hypothetical protein
VFRHVVLLRWLPGTTDAQVQAAVEGLRGLPAAIPEIAEYQVGTDAGVDDGNVDLAIVADFGSVDDYVTYRDHPVHRALIAERIRPILAGRMAVQHHLD